MAILSPLERDLAITPVCVCGPCCVVSVKERLQPAPVYDISHLSGVEKLTEEERVLCQVCRLHPEALLGYMAQLEVEGRRFGGVLRLVDARRLLKIDVNKTRKIFNFLASKGRISQ